MLTSLRGRRRTLVAVLMIAALLVGGALIAVSALSKPEVTTKPIVTFVGDSYTAGSPEDSGPQSRYPAIIGHRLHVRDVVTADLGAGYLTRGLDDATFAGQVARIPTTSNVVVIFGSRNDPFDGKSTERIYTAADRLYSAIRDRVPSARVVVVGPTYVEKPLPLGGQQAAAAIKAAATDHDFTYVDALTWFQSTPPGYIGADSLHPTDTGHAYLATKMMPFVRTALRD